ncbi:hypothetical protein JQX13_03980 [Archangium violaceum]|uniref:hypothetical protein n=1 Tax=Archangium violaceum TaxID=83451 RepID=UPI00193B43ED|nr:hypothetical protein [Archangium violaceum]QRK09314.1 hypothetical protein JQX13_03980 [Archangium violaceum]
MKRMELLGVLLLTLTGGCGVQEMPTAPSRKPGHTVQDLEMENSLTTNGLAFNGLAFNGLAFNGLAFNGLSSSVFSAWFQRHPEESNLFMKYLVRCAVPPGQTRTYSHGGITYTWSGGLGLAPSWASGSPVTLREQQVVSACLAALVNKYGRNVTVSLLGMSAMGQRIPYTASELNNYSLREACFFGNLFNDEGLFVGNDQGLLSTNQSSFRACALWAPNTCPPLTHIGSCHTSCQHDATGTYFTQCTRGGITYPAITTRIRPQDISTCGDGICQPSELCGNSNRASSCKDCGRCPR